MNHRPEVFSFVPNTERVCDSFEYEYFRIADYEEATGRDVYLVGGAGLIPQQFVDVHTIVNAHPGFIPYARGLDALKWAILKGMSIGVTTHLLGPEVDAGWVIERRQLELHSTESFFELGTRVYYNEVEMLVDAISKVDESYECIAGDYTDIHRRMPYEPDQKLLEAYRERLKKEGHEQNHEFSSLA